MSNIYRQIAGHLPQGFAWVADWVEHPSRGDKGSLVRNERTGLYAMLIGGAMVSVPQDWARRQGRCTSRRASNH